MIALIPVCSDEKVAIGEPYLARVDEHHYVVVYPRIFVQGYPKPREADYRMCDYVKEDGESFYAWQELHELARII